ncbi:9467_t:CDS:2, partial [Racocetra persica]
IFTSINAESGFVLLPPYDGGWYNCTNDILAAVNKSFSIKLVDYSTPATPGFGAYGAGNSSLKRIRGIGFLVFSYVANSTVPFTFTEFNNREVYNMVDYCGTKEFTTTQCDSPFMGFPNQTKQMKWCLAISNPFNNSQKTYVSFSPDDTSTNSTKNDMS